MFIWAVGFRLVWRLLGMDWGQRNRLSRIIRPKDGHSVMLAVDHGYFMGPTTGLERLGVMVSPLLRFADTLMLTRGALRQCIDPCVDVPVVVRVSGGTSIIGRELLHEGTVCSVEDALRLNASGVAYSIMVGAEFERDTLLGFTQYVDEAQRYGLPVVAVTAVGKEMVRDARYMGLASRIAAELGADIVKTYFVKDFESVIESCPVPVVIAGGKKLPEEEALEMAFNAISAGACGVDMGRNIFQSSKPVGMMKAIQAIVHRKATVKEAYDIFKAEPAAKK